MKKIFGVLAGLVAFLAIWLVPSFKAHAVSQWARKYDMSCQSCHTAFPRLNYFGEKFARNGYQLPDTEDGDEAKKKIGDNVFVDNLINMFGVRVAVTPLSFTTKGMTRENNNITNRFSIGNTNWVQFFSAGTIFKNASIFIETEVENAAIHNNWFTLGYHNIGSSWLNLRVGKLSVMNWHAQTGRLRMIPNIQVEGWKNFLSAEGTSGMTIQDQVAMGEPQPGIELYGYQGPFLYSMGVTNGSALTDNNEFKNLFGTLRLELPEGDLQGSSISGWGYWGTDSATTGTTRRIDRLYRFSVASNLRWQDWDVIAAYLYGHDKDWILSTDALDTNKTHALSGQIGYMINPKWFAAGQYDYITDSFKNTGETNNHYHKVSPTLWYMPRENMRIGLVNRFELRGRDGGRQHEFVAHVRAMF